MTSRVLAAAAAGLLLVACGGDDDGASDPADGAGVDLRDPWSRWTAAGTTVGAIYVELTSPVDDTLTGVSVDPSVAGSTMLHLTMESEHDMTTMEHAHGIELPAGETVALAPGGAHVMLDGLTEPLAEGASFEATFEFATAADQTVTVEILADAPSP